MNRKFYYVWVIILSSLISFGCISCGSDDSTTPQPSPDAADRDAAGNLKVSAVNFPDENFRSFLLSQGYGADGVLTQKEIADIKSLEIPSLNIRNLNGIAFFTSLVELDCEHNLITSLDMSKNVLLQYLKCEECQITTLDVSKNVKLTKLACHSNQLTSLDISKNIALKDLHCPHNKLVSLDVSNNPDLIRLSCSDNKLTSLDVSKNTLLEELYCNDNQLTYLDVSNNTRLADLRYDTDKVTIYGWPK
jgi:hypothetical protein